MSFRRWQKLITSRISSTVFDPLSREVSICGVLKSAFFALRSNGDSSIVTCFRFHSLDGRMAPVGTGEGTCKGGAPAAERAALKSAAIRLKPLRHRRMPHGQIQYAAGESGSEVLHHEHR